MGIEGQDITPQLAESFNLQNVKGVIVAGIQRNGPAAKAGMRAGDVIIGVNGEEIADRRTVMDVIAQIKPGKKLSVNVLRAGKTIKLNAIVGERPRANSHSGQRG